jgi:hypothetical protein
MNKPDHFYRKEAANENKNVLRPKSGTTLPMNKLNRYIEILP